MTTASVEQTYVIAERFDKALRLIRSTMAEMELSVVDEFDTVLGPGHESKRKAERSKLLLVDSPLLVFEALALDRAAGVFVPVHLLVSPDGNRTQVTWMEPASLFDVRLPVGSAEPLRKLRTRVARALEVVSARSRTNHHQPAGEV